MSRYIKVKERVRSIAEVAMWNEHTDEIFIHNVGGVNLYILMKPQAKIYDLVFCSVSYDNFANIIRGGGKLRLQSERIIDVEHYKNAEKLIERVAVLIYQNDYRV